MERCTPRSLGRLSISLAVTVAFADLAAQATAGSAEERERERMQQELNEQVIAAPFSVEDDLPSRPSCRPTFACPIDLEVRSRRSRGGNRSGFASRALLL